MASKQRDIWDDATYMIRKTSLLMIRYNNRQRTVVKINSLAVENVNSHSIV
jgi:hypothetical protein